MKVSDQSRTATFASPGTESQSVTLDLPRRPTTAISSRKAFETQVPPESVDVIPSPLEAADYPAASASHDLG
jgi:hypothetical protein